MKTTALKQLMREYSAHITEKTQEIYDLIPGDGNVDSDVMCITTYPSAKEENTGVHFEGNAGSVFEGFLMEFGLGRKSVYTTYAVKYRPYAISSKSGRIVNRNVTSDEINLFRPYLISEIETIRPKFLIVLGDVAFETLLEEYDGEMPGYGTMMAVTVNGTDYDLLMMPHPGEKKFGNISISDTVKQRLALAGTPSAGLFEVGNVDESEANSNAEIKDATYPKSVSFASIEKERAVYDRKPRPEPKRSKKGMSGRHKVILVYGGTKLSNDPSFVVAERVSGVLTELNVKVKRMDLYKEDYRMDAFIDELDEADGIIIATTVEWFGIGGVLQTFLDRAYQSGCFGAFEGVYLFNIVVSRHSFEREASNHILKSWEILGGIEGVNICTSIESSADIETNADILFAIDKKAEDFYRVINQQRKALPTSINDNKVILRMPVDSTETAEVLSAGKPVSGKYVHQGAEHPKAFISNYDEFIEKQQKDIEDIASLFKVKLATEVGNSDMKLPEIFVHKYSFDSGFGNCTFSWTVNDSVSENFTIMIKGKDISWDKGKRSDADVIISSSQDVINRIVQGNLSIQRAFMTGEVKAKGNFTLLYKLDGVFKFGR